MTRITIKQLEAVVARINKATGSPTEPYTRKDGKLVANIGNYHLSEAYGGVALHRMATDGGGVSDVFGGHMPKRELYGKLNTFLDGISAAKRILHALSA